MTYLILIISCVISANCFGQQNYVVQLGDSTYDVSLDSSYQITIAGKKINLSLKQKNILALEDTLFGFSYLSGFQVTKSAIDPKVDQYLILTADATGFIVQAYRTINPTDLNETMLREMTKQNISYGYSMQRHDSSRILKSGQIIPVNKATLTFKDSKYVVEVASIGSRDEGILIITIDSGLDYTGKGKELIRLLWESLRYNK